MRGRRNRGSLVGCIAIVTGFVIILSLILPSGFWWFAFGAGLIGLGLWLNSRC
ncbi:MAG: hypothetical protein Q4E45_11825 [Eubacteriales bacterium]|nr:hypothetical protein [Eubacteriales bacterium]